MHVKVSTVNSNILLLYAAIASWSYMYTYMYLFPNPYNATNSYDSNLVPMLCHSGSETG